VVDWLHQKSTRTNVDRCPFTLSIALLSNVVKLNAVICKLEKMKKNINYIISCNGNFTEKELKEIVANC